MCTGPRCRPLVDERNRIPILELFSEGVAHPEVMGDLVESCL